MPRRRLAHILPLCLVAGFWSAARPAEFAWKSRFTDASSQALAEVHELIHKAHDTGMTSVPVNGLVWTEADLELRLESGTLFLEPPIQGQVVGGFFEGKATVSFRPSWGPARTDLEMALGRETLEAVPIDTVYLFSLRPDSLLASRAGAASGGTAAVPAVLETYKADKSAMRQLGLELTAAFLNRRGPALGATYALFPMREIRVPRSEEARLLYRLNPEIAGGVALAVFGHEEMATLKPWKFKFWDLASYDARRESPGLLDVERYATTISLGTAPKSAVEEARIDLKLGPGVGALRFDLWIQMEVSAVTDAAGTPLPFLQWKTLRNDDDFDQTLLVRLDEKAAAGGPTSVTVKSAGLLFEPWFGSFVLIDEDNWYPKLPLEGDDAHFELELTVPKGLIGIGVGEKVLDEVKGPSRRMVFKATQPAKNSTFYFGDYSLTPMPADGVIVELFQDRKDVEQKQKAKFIATEIANAVKVFNRLFVPLDIKTLRVTATRQRHGRGFEGLLLLGGGATETSSSSEADLFRAHEVAHEWWGHYVRPRRWPEDRWLSEAFAEYSAMEYYQVRFEDPGKARQVMTEHWLQPLTEGSMRRKMLTGDVEKTVGGTVFPLLAGKDNVYTKGPLVLHMLRYLFKVQKKDDQVFFAALRDFLQTYRYRSASTSDFQAIAEKHLGMKLDWFFEQWVADGGLPVLKWSHEVAQEGGSWVVKLQATQEQKKYRLLVPVYIRLGGDKIAVTPWLIEGESASRTVKVPSKPESVSLNDNLESLVILKGL